MVSLPIGGSGDSTTFLINQHHHQYSPLQPSTSASAATPGHSGIVATNYNMFSSNHHQIVGGQGVVGSTSATNQTRYFSQFSTSSSNSLVVNNNHEMYSNTNRLQQNFPASLQPQQQQQQPTTTYYQQQYTGYIKQEQQQQSQLLQQPPPSQINSSNSLEATVTNNGNNNNEDDSAMVSDEKDALLPGEDGVDGSEEVAEEQEPQPEVDIVINNVVCSFSVRCHLSLRDIALNGFNVEYRRENGMVTMKLRQPYTTASIWSSGRITCTGATSEDQAKIAARRYARCLQKLGFNVRFNNFRVVNVLGTCSMPWAIKIVNFSEKYKKDASYEPELHPGVTYKLRYPKATLKIFSTGSITVTAASVAYVQAAIEHIFPLVYEFRKQRTPAEIEALKNKQKLRAQQYYEAEESRQEHSRKRKRSNEEEEIPGASADIEEVIYYEEEYDNVDDLIEGPDDEDDDDL